MNLVSALLHGRLGLRVRTPVGAQHISSGVFIPAGTEGITKSATCAGAIVGVQWDGRDDVLDWKYSELEVLPSKT